MEANLPTYNLTLIITQLTRLSQALIIRKKESTSLNKARKQNIGLALFLPLSHQSPLLYRAGPEHHKILIKNVLLFYDC
jgi:hypothetical protein